MSLYCWQYTLFVCLLWPAPAIHLTTAPPTALPSWCLPHLTDERQSTLPPLFSYPTKGFEFFQTSVVFHRGMAVQHKAESHQTLLQSDVTLQPLPGNRACAGTPTHWGLYSALTFSGSHLPSRGNLVSSKETTFRVPRCPPWYHIKIFLLFVLPFSLQSNLSSFISTIIFSFFTSPLVSPEPPHLPFLISSTSPPHLPLSSRSLSAE